MPNIVKSTSRKSLKVICVSALGFLLLVPVSSKADIRNIPVLTNTMPNNTLTEMPQFMLGSHSLVANKLDGTPVDISAQPGWKAVYFWSSACPCVAACQKYSFLPLATHYQGKLQIYAVVSGQYDLNMPRPKLSALIAAQHLPYSVLLDSDHSVAKNLGALVTPQVFLLDPQNHIVFSGMPDDSRRYLDLKGHSGITQSYLGRAIAEVLAGKPVTEPHSQIEGCIIGY
jgi:hypothetical protein